MKNFIFFLVALIGYTSSVFAQNEQSLALAERLKNSYPDSRRYDEVCFLTAHNAYASFAEGWKGYVQQSKSFEEQFAYGVRSFMIDLYWYKSNEAADPYIALCHQSGAPKKDQERLSANSNCALTTRLRWQEPQQALEFFQKVAGWLGVDEQAIITVHLESYLGKDSAPDLWNILREAGVDQYVYLPPHPVGPSKWPTLGQLRKSNKRLIIFSDNKDDNVIWVWAYRETQFDLKEFPGAEMRANGRGLPKGTIIKGKLASDIYPLSQLLVMNHFYSISFPAHYPVVNSGEEIFKRVNLCYAQENRLPNFIAVDFVEEGLDGGALAVVLMLNARPPENFSEFKGPILPEVPFSPLSLYNQAAQTFKSSIYMVCGALGTLVAGSSLYCCYCKRKAGSKKTSKTE
jgi:hypothetical protein